LISTGAKSSRSTSSSGGAGGRAACASRRAPGSGRAGASRDAGVDLGAHLAHAQLSRALAAPVLILQILVGILVLPLVDVPEPVSSSRARRARASCPSRPCGRTARRRRARRSASLRDAHAGGGQTRLPPRLLPKSTAADAFTLGAREEEKSASGRRCAGLGARRLVQGLLVGYAVNCRLFARREIEAGHPGAPVAPRLGDLRLHGIGRRAAAWPCGDHLAPRAQQIGEGIFLACRRRATRNCRTTGRTATRAATHRRFEQFGAG